MKIQKKIQDGLNKQINHEFYAAYQYLSMSAYFESINLKGFAHWMRLQAKEEVEHGMKLYNNLVDRGGKLILLKVDAPSSEWKSPTAAFEQAYKNEQAVTVMINKLFELAKSEKDHATEVFLQWFITEQVEEEATTYEILQKLKMAKGDSSSVLLIDHELGKEKE